ncbi:hypothetical protein ATCC90586_007874 [Pythium insidiosum]|nr:hypothetical protein ATCC90586_007874 [Pythium insidiosum]
MAPTASEFLHDFNAQLAQFVSELEQIHKQSVQEHAFQPTFWLQNEDFTLARDVFVAASGTIEHEITKFSLVFSKTALPSQDEASSICEAIKKPCEQLLAATKVALYCGAGPSLGDEIILGALRVLKNVRELGATVERKELTRVPELTGRVWESCKAIGNTPKSNCIASKRNMLQCVGVLNDTIKELKEFLEEQASTSGEEGLDAIELDDDFAFDSSLSDEERSVFESGVKLLEMVVSVLKRGVLTLKNLTIEDSAKDVIAWTARLDRGYKTVQAAVVDMGAALYPPVDVDELQSALDLVSKSGRAVLESLLAQQDLGDKEIHALESGCRAFDQQVATVKTQLDAART